MTCLPLTAVQELPDNKHEATLAPLPLFLVRACSGGAYWGKAAGAPHTPEGLPEHALCHGGVIQCEMSGQGAFLYLIPP